MAARSLRPFSVPRWRRVLAIPLTALTASLLPTLAVRVAAQDPPPTSAGFDPGPGCVAIASPAWAALQAGQSAAEPREARGRPRAAGEARPPTERELRLLIRAFEVVEVGEEKTRVVRALVERTELSLERIGVLLADVSAVLATIHARETMTGLEGTGGASYEGRDWLQKTLQAIPDCARSRFDGRGGEAAFTSSLRLVERYRRELERTLLQAPQLSPLEPPRLRGRR